MLESLKNNLLDCQNEYKCTVNSHKNVHTAFVFYNLIDLYTNRSFVNDKVIY